MIFENLSLCLAKDLCEKFPKSKIWDVHFLHFSMLIVIIYIFVCHMQPYLVQNWHRKWAIFIFFHNLIIFENISLNLVKISVMKFPKSKIWDVHFLHFSVPIVMRYVFFATSNSIWWKNGRESAQFSYVYFFWKSLITFCIN